MYATCTRGHRHWGLAGAAGALLVAPGPGGSRVLLTLRSPEVHQGGTWSTPGGAIDPGETALQAARREVREELLMEVDALPVLARSVFECGGWSYTTVLIGAPEATPLVAQGWETDEVRWFELDDVARLPTLHPAFAASWPGLRRLVLVSTAEDPHGADPASTLTG